MSDRFSGAIALACASLVLGGPAQAGPQKDLRVANTSVVMDHVKIETDTPYRVATGRLEAEVKQFSDHYRTLLEQNNIYQLRRELSHDYAPSGFMIHFVAAQGNWLALEGKRTDGKVYYIGNVLSASRMTKYNFGAALYAPLKLNVYANVHGGTTFEYDRPSTQFGQFHNPGIDEVAKELDVRLLQLIKVVSR